MYLVVFLIEFVFAFLYITVIINKLNKNVSMTGIIIVILLFTFAGYGCMSEATERLRFFYCRKRYRSIVTEKDIDFDRLISLGVDSDEVAKRSLVCGFIWLTSAIICVGAGCFLICKACAGSTTDALPLCGIALCFCLIFIDVGFHDGTDKLTDEIKEASKHFDSPLPTLK